MEIWVKSLTIYPASNILSTDRYQRLDKKLMQDILKDYNSGSRPSGSVSDQGVSVSINVVPLHVQVSAHDAHVADVAQLRFRLYRHNDIDDQVEEGVT